MDIYDGKKIGIFGGTFDPVHIGHLFLAETARDVCGLDKVLFMLSPDPYYRTDKQVSPALHRINMLKAAIADNPAFEFSDFELGLEQPVYSARTMELFKAQHPGAELYFIIGGDSLFSIESWKEPEKLFASCVILSGKREDEAKGASGTCKPGEEALNGTLRPSDVNGDGQVDLEDEIEARMIYLREKYGADIRNLNVRNIEISSSDIIRRIRSGQTIKYFTPDPVLEYIKNNDMYMN